MNSPTQLFAVLFRSLAPSFMAIVALLLRLRFLIYPVIAVLNQFLSYCQPSHCTLTEPTQWLDVTYVLQAKNGRSVANLSANYHHNKSPSWPHNPIMNLRPNRYCSFSSFFFFYPPRTSIICNRKSHRIINGAATKLNWMSSELHKSHSFIHSWNWIWPQKDERTVSL